jgi:tetratricopeptide (TPR) repeat protein
MTGAAASTGRPTVKRVGRSAGVAIALVLLACEPARSQTLPAAESAMQSGNYDAAISAFTALSASDTAPAAARRGLVRALTEVGRYDAAETAARRFATPDARGREFANTLGEVLVFRGKLTEAEAAFRRAMTEKASDSLTARVNLATLRFDRGERDEAMREFDHFIDVYNGAQGRLKASELTAIAIACRYLGLENPALFKDALRAFDQALELAPTALEPRVRVAELFLEKIQSAEAQKELDQVLKVNPRHPEALLASARRRQFDGEPGADSLVRLALEVNPNLVPARVFYASLLLDSESYDRALAETRRALEVDSTSLEALGMAAAIHKLAGDERAFEDAKRRALARNPRYADLFSTVAELSARNRLYDQAVDFARQATVVDPKSWRAHGLLGMNQLRVGDIDSGRVSLERAFKGDPYDVWVKNTLDLMDTYKDYTLTSTPRFTLFIGRKESQLLAPYLGDLLEEAYDRFATTYGYKPKTPIRAEVYRSHADFSVRTVGLAGLGALGVSFGQVLAIDSPGARETGAFNWGSTVWHELAHTFTLGMTNHRVPRWLSEGISVYEERRGRPGWGADATVSFLSAYNRKMLVPVSRMNDGFMRPAYPEQVIHSYYQASLVCELIERDFGARAITRMLEGYRDGQNTDQVFQQVLHTDLASFDKRFDAYMQERFAKVAATIRTPSRAAPAGRPGLGGDAALPSGTPDPNDFVGQLTMGRALFDEGDLDGAVVYFERAKTLFPDYAGNDSPRWYLARIHKDRGAFAKAADELRVLTAANENHYAAHLDLADVLQALGDDAGAAAILDRAMYISPYDPAMHTRLAALYSKTGNRPRAVRERRAVVALAPVDRAEALYQLALAYQEAGDATSARREVLHALEEAPNFEKAQTLLLALRRTPAPASAPARPPK